MEAGSGSILRGGRATEGVGGGEATRTEEWRGRGGRECQLSKIRMDGDSHAGEARRGLAPRGLGLKTIVPLKVWWQVLAIVFFHPKQSS